MYLPKNFKNLSCTQFHPLFEVHFPRFPAISTEKYRGTFLFGEEVFGGRKVNSKVKLF